MRFYTVSLRKSTLWARPWAVIHRTDSGVRHNHNLLRSSSWAARSLSTRSSFDAKSIRKFLGDGSVPAGAVLAASDSANVPSPWLVTSAVIGLPLALWIYKCLMMVIFQRKIIYMGGIPLGSRSEELRINERDITVDEITIQNKSVKLSGIIVSRPGLAQTALPPLVIMYLQGNAGNPLHRIPKFRLLAGKLTGNFEREVHVIAVAPRSYWKSTNTSPSEAGFLSDYTAVLEWISTAYPSSPVVLYGHSIGGSIAVKLLGSLPNGSTSLASRVRGLVLENAFTSMPAMVRAVYPSKWLPYYYLGPFVFDKWDALSTIQQCALSSTSRPSALQNVILNPPSILIINSEIDELVPSEMGQEMLGAASKVHQGLPKPLGTGPRRVVIPGALHDGAFTKRQWKEAMRMYLAEVANIDSYRQSAALDGLQPRAEPQPDWSGNVNNWRSILTIIVFLVANILVIAPFRIPLPRFLNKPLSVILFRKSLSEPHSRPYFPVNYVSAPVFGVFFLWAAQCIDGTIVKNGIVGTGGIKPLDIMALFISLAYIAIALDATGLLRFLAFWVVRKGGSSGPRLYLFLYIFFFTFGVIVGNDPIILSGTAFLAYLTRVAGITPPTAWIFAQFCAANIGWASAVLVSSNPTNLVVAGGFQISFLVFTANLVLPVFASAVAVYPVLRWFLFRSEALIPASIFAQDLDPKAALVDSHGAIFGSTLMITTLLVLVGTSTAGLHVEVWMITVPAAIIMFLRDVLHDVNAHRRKSEVKSKSNPTSPIEEHHSGGPIPNDVGETPRESDNIELAKFPSEATRRVSNGSIPKASAINEPVARKTSFPFALPAKFPSEATRRVSNGSIPKASAINEPVARKTSFPFALPRRFPTPTTTLRRLPYPLLPFAFAMFILVQGLASTGWIAVFAGWWAAWARASGILGVVGGMGFVSVCLCNLCGTNIGATILLARVIQVWEEIHSPSARFRHGAIYALAISSNYGAFSTVFSASLAGLLWRDILRQKGIIVKRSEFAKLNLALIFVSMLVGCSVLIAQIYVKPPSEPI
ncbi:unnamed protein product [Rhizoctonia solani]|uniref:Uncharacterized protein n=1 Tax=Rhizoctonia solani TaxID=456999 RepID=A0A8H3DQR3_9AGAM|nr:unnamed protein product [Rhizoctonia solani]